MRPRHGYRSSVLEQVSRSKNKRRQRIIFKVQLREKENTGKCKVTAKAGAEKERNTLLCMELHREGHPNPRGQHKEADDTLIPGIAELGSFSDLKDAGLRGSWSLESGSRELLS